MTETRPMLRSCVVLAAGLGAACGAPDAAASGANAAGADRPSTAATGASAQEPAAAVDPAGGADASSRRGAAMAESPSDSLEIATFAGGCFWCVEEAFEKVDGVVEVISGYTGGDVDDPSYEQVSSGRTGHYEAARVRYDPERVSYERLLEVFWHNVDPTDAGGQFCDRGPQYRTAIFVHGPEQREAAERSKRRLQEGDRIEEEVVTPVLEASEFWPAEDHHQDYYREHRVRYEFYKASCGRQRTLDEVWGDRAEGG